MKDKEVSKKRNKYVTIGNGDEAKEVSYDDLDYILDVLREEQKTIIDFISDKEQKKLQVFRFQLAAIAILAAASVAALPLLEDFVSRQNITNLKIPEMGGQLIFIVYLVLNIIGLVMLITTNLMGSTVMRHIMSIKTDVMVAIRQINCNREAIQKAITAKLYGKYPIGDWTKNEHKCWPASNELYIRHNKFTTDNNRLRNIFLRRHRNWFIRGIWLVVYPFGGWLLRRRCRDAKCNKNEKGKKCYKIRVNGKIGHYARNRFHEIDIDDEELPNGKILKWLLFGYRSAYVQSADMMAVVATGAITVLVSLLLPLGNFYLWYRLDIVLIDSQPDLVINALKYSTLFCAIDTIVILIFVKHFFGIADRSMNRIIKLLANDS